ncbi:MAG: pilus assembly protein [Anaerolineales bacterium]|jgi:pilus assembly protein Flp/PilA
MKPKRATRKSESGQGMLEYGLIIILVAILVMVLLLVLGPSTGNMFSNVTVNI